MYYSIQSCTSRPFNYFNVSITCKIIFNHFLIISVVIQEIRFLTSESTILLNELGIIKKYTIIEHNIHLYTHRTNLLNILQQCSSTITLPQHGY